MDSRVIAGIVFGLAISFLLAYMLIPTKAFNEPSILVVNQTSSETAFQNNTSVCNYNINQVVNANNPRTVQLVSCNNNQILYSSTNATLVFNQLFTKINADGGGRVHVTGYSQNGTLNHAYNFSGSVALPDSGYLDIFGDGSFTVLKATRDNVDMFYTTGTKSVDIYFNTWRDMRFEGFPSGTNNTAFYLNSSVHGYHDSLFVNLFIENFGNDDVFINTVNSWNMQFTNDVFELAGNYCIEHTGGSDTRILTSKFLFCKGAYAVKLAGGLNTIASSWFYQNSQSGILLGNQPNVVTNNKFFDNGLSKSNTYFDIAFSSSTNGEITGNTFSASDQTNKTKCAIDIGDAASINNNISVNNFNPNPSSSFGTAPICGFHAGGVNTIVNNVGWNPRGKVTSFIDNSGAYFVSESGTSSTVVNATTYIISDSPVFVVSTGGTGVSITLQDNNGNNIQTGLLTLSEQYIPVNYKIKWTWVTAPTVTVYFQ